MWTGKDHARRWKLADSAAIVADRPVIRRSRMPPDSGRLKLAGNADFTRTKSAPLWPVFLVVCVLVPPEMQRGRAPLVNIPPFGREYSRHRGLPIRCGLLKSAEGKPLHPVHRLDEPS